MRRSRLMGRALPMLCECVRLDGCVEHRDIGTSYVLWVLHSGASHVVFLHQRWLNCMEYTDGQTFLELLSQKGPEEACKMISRTLLGALGYKPDYIVIVSDVDSGAPYASGLCMETALGVVPMSLTGIRAIAEGPPGDGRNLIGARLTALCGVLADKGFFQDPKSRRYLRRRSIQILKTETAPATKAATIHVS